MRLNALEWGRAEGAPVVALHGLTGHALRYRRLAEEHLADHRVVALDLRGHGLSTWAPPWGIPQHLDDLVDTAAALGIECATWIGHSFGGRLVAELAAARPALVGRAVLLDPAMQLDPVVVEERAALACADTSFASPDEAVETRLADGSLYTTPREVLVEEAAAHLERGPDGRWRSRHSPPAAVVAWSEMATAAPPWPACPTLLVLGACSWIPIAAPDVGNVELLRTPGGHSPLWDDYPLTAAAIATFLASER